MATSRPHLALAMICLIISIQIESSLEDVTTSLPVLAQASSPTSSSVKEASSVYSNTSDNQPDLISTPATHQNTSEDTLTANTNDTIIQNTTSNPASESSLDNAHVTTDHVEQAESSTSDHTKGVTDQKVTSGMSDSSSIKSSPYVSKQTIQPTTTVTYNTEWLHVFLHTHHFEGQYMFNDAAYPFDFVVRFVHPLDSRTLVTIMYDNDGAVLEFNGTCTNGRDIVFEVAKIYTPGVRFPLNEQLEFVGSFSRKDQPYFSGNFTRPVNSSFTWIHMNKGLGAIETGDDIGTRTAIIIIIPTCIAFLGVCGTVAIVCWANKKGYLRGRHKSYRLFTNAQVSYESEAETIHI